MSHYGPMSAALRKAARVCRDHPELQQFGQPNDDKVWGGRTACTHTICQTLLLIWKGKKISLNRVNELAGMRANPYRIVDGVKVPIGMNADQLATFFRNTGLPYKIVYGYSWAKLKSYLHRGPILYGMRYGSAPEWEGKVYNGVRASRPFAIKAGKTQLTGFENGRHAVALLGRRTLYANNGSVIGAVAYRKEPNHGSPARPERPPYDIVRLSQARAEYEAYASRLGLRLYAAIPTRSLT